MGVFDNLVKIQGKVATVEQNLQAAANDPVVLAVKEGIKLMPEGELKSWVSKNPAQFWKSIAQLFTGRKYTSKQYTLGERYLDQLVQDNNDANFAKSQTQVPDDIVPIAQQAFTMLFGVRVTTQDDLDALQSGKAAYKARPDKTDMSDAAIDRAVYLKRTFFPDSLYNTQKWDLRQFEKVPLVAPIPGIDPGTLYNGELPGGAIAKNGIIDGDGVLKQVLDSIVVDPNTGVPTIPGTATPSKINWGKVLIWGLVAYGGYQFFKSKGSR